MGHYSSCYEYDDKVEEFTRYVHNFYDVYDKIQILQAELDRLNPHIQDMLDQGFGYVVDEVITSRQKARNE